MGDSRTTSPDRRRSSVSPESSAARDLDRRKVEGGPLSGTAQPRDRPRLGGCAGCATRLRRVPQRQWRATHEPPLQIAAEAARHPSPCSTRDLDRRKAGRSAALHNQGTDRGLGAVPAVPQDCGACHGGSWRATHEPPLQIAAEAARHRVLATRDLDIRRRALNDTAQPMDNGSWGGVP